MRVVLPYTDPISGAVPRDSLSRALWRLKHRARSLVGARRGFKVEGVYYKEITTELLAKALSRRGTGEKEYRVTFPTGPKMLIRCSMKRPYADIMGPVMLPQYQRAQAMIRPGMRVLSALCGTGHAVEWLAVRVGPSGAVVALDTDAESIAYAQRRYARQNVAFEAGGAGALSGEVDGSFNASFMVTPAASAISPALIAETWRVTAPGGWMLIGCPADAPRSAIEDNVRGLATTEGGEASIPAMPEWLSTNEDAFHAVLVRKLTGG